MSTVAPPPGISAFAPTAMTLCGISYAFPECIQTYLDRSSLTRSWKATWVPNEQKGCFAYVATSDATRGYVVAIRGTNPSFTPGFLLDIIADGDVLISPPWESEDSAGACISRGAHNRLRLLTTLRDERGESLFEHLERVVPEGGTVAVTGHSLGGELAAVLALWLAQRAAGRFAVRPITFAAPTAGNRQFAELYLRTFPDAERYFNHLDLVPRAWHDLAEFGGLYPSPGPRCPPAFALTAGGLSRAISARGYSHAGAGTPLGDETPRYTRPEGLIARVAEFFREKLFFVEALHHHMPDAYLANLGAPALPFKLPLPWLARGWRRKLMPKSVKCG